MEKGISKKDIKSIAVFRALKVGDMICSVPALRALKLNFPTAKITLIGLPWAKEFADRFSNYIDEFIAFPGFVGLPEQSFDAKKFLEFLGDVRRREFDLALQMQGDGTFTNSLVEQFRAKVSAGLYVRGGYVPSNDTYFEYPNDEHEIKRLLFLIKSLGLKTYGDYLEFPTTISERKSAKDLKEKNKILDNYAVVHPGASEEKKRGNKKTFIDASNALIDKGYEIVLTGSSEEKNLCFEIEKEIKGKVTNLSGKTNLGELAAIISEASFVVSSDTSISHIATAVNTPSIVVFTKYSDPLRWAPLNSSVHRVLRDDSSTKKTTSHMAILNRYLSRKGIYGI